MAPQRVLFICSQNKLRSPTAEQVFANWPGIECTSAGTNRGADTALTAELVEWADVIFVMEKQHQRKLAEKFRPQLKHARVVCLGIPDNYSFMQPELVALLEAKVSRYLSDSKAAAGRDYIDSDGGDKPVNEPPPSRT